MGSRARQVRFMSTQKRENRSQRLSCSDRAGWGAFPGSRHVARLIWATAANGRTAPLLSIFWSAMAWAATKFLHSDHHIRQLVRPVLKADRRGSPPPQVRFRAALGKQASPRSSIPRIPYPSGPVSLHRPLPHGPFGPKAPAASRRRAERYDGKGNMYLQHAA